MIRPPAALSDIDVPVYGWWPVWRDRQRSQRQHAEEPHGQRIIVAGRVIDEDGGPLSGALVEI